ncbi:MAG: GTP cyclohydrolase MptA [Thermoplasmata archaeon]|nr:GTP cyclohydrolase MptA [Thermoplasmata archaeon]
MEPTAGRFELHKVGISGIRKPLTIRRPDRAVTLTTTFDVAVDLPSTRKGSDLSRNAILLAEIVDETTVRPVPSLESACVAIARELLVRHKYARTATVDVSAEYFLRRGITEERRSFEDYTILAAAQSVRAGTDGPVTVTKSIGAEALGMTACPCAMETAREALSEEFPLLRDPSMKSLPMITHNQRNRTRLMFDLSEEVEIEVDDLISTIEAAQSSPTFAILKRGDEAKMVIQAHRHPKFVEDVLRDLLRRVATGFEHVPDVAFVRARTVSEESIHKYNVVAAHQASLGELRHASAA